MLSNTNFEVPQTAPAHNGAYVKIVISLTSYNLWLRNIQAGLILFHSLIRIFVVHY